MATKLMLNQLFTTKVRTSQQFVGVKRTPTTVLALPKQVVTGVRTKNKDGYDALVVAVGLKNKVANKPQIKTLKDAGYEKKPRWTREIRLVEAIELTSGNALPLNEIIAEGDTVKVTGTSKGKGFSGVMKRHGFAGQPKTHGQSDRARAPGSIGRGTTPGRVVKGKKMAGRMGNDTVSITGLKVLNVDLENNLITIKGVVPGSNSGLIRLTVTKKNPNPVTKVEEVVATEAESTTEATQE